MAILRNLWIRNSRKRLAGAVTYVLKGQTIARELAAHIQNVRSTPQMTQRTRLANIVNTWKMISFWAKHGAFETKLQKQSDYNAFVQANINNVRVFLTKSLAESGATIIAPYVITKGSLVPITTYYDASAEGFITNIYVGDIEVTANTTLGDLANAIISSNNGIANGDQISYIQVLQTSVAGIPKIVVRAYEYTLDISDTTPFDYDSIGSWLGVDSDSNGKQVLYHSAVTTTEGGAFIISRKVGGKIKVSSSTLTLSDEAQAYYLTYTNYNAQLNAIASYGESGGDFLAPGDMTSDSSQNIVITASLLSASVSGSQKNDSFSTFDAAANAPVIFNFSGILPDGTEATSAYIKNDETTSTLTGLTVSGSQVTGSSPTAVENVSEIGVTLNNGRTYKLVKVSGGGNADPGDVTP